VERTGTGLWLVLDSPSAGLEEPLSHSRNPKLDYRNPLEGPLDSMAPSS
jgi:hypothetical protein